jgi:hypothetical protein
MTRRCTVCVPAPSRLLVCNTSVKYDGTAALVEVARIQSAATPFESSAPLSLSKTLIDTVPPSVLSR